MTRPRKLRARAQKRQRQGKIRSRSGLLAELGDTMSQTRNLPASGVLVNDALLSRPHDDRLGGGERPLGAPAVAGRDGFLDLHHGGAQPRAPGLVDKGTPRDLAGRLAGRAWIWPPGVALSIRK